MSGYNRECLCGNESTWTERSTHTSPHRIDFPHPPRIEYEDVDGATAAGGWAGSGTDTIHH